MMYIYRINDEVYINPRNLTLGHFMSLVQSCVEM